MGKLKRTINFKDLVFYGVGVILGAGIYALIGKGAGLAGNSLWISFTIGAVIACLTAFSFAELSSMMPEAAGPYVYIKKAFNLKILPFITTWLLAIVGTATSATVALGFSGYFNSILKVANAVIIKGPFFEITSITLVSILLILLFGFLIYRSMKQSANLNMIFTIIEASGLAIIIFLGIFFVTQGNAVPNLFDMPNGLGGVIGAMTLIFFAYLGFEEIVYMAEDVENPKKTVPKAIMWSIIITSIIYILVAISAVTILPWAVLGESNAPLGDVATKAMGSGAGLLLSLIALFSTSNTVLITMIATSRIIYGLSKQKVIPNFLSDVSGVTGTPYVAIIITTIAACLFAVMNDIAAVAELANFGLFAVFLLVNLALIKTRYETKRIAPFRAPINLGKFPALAGLGALACFASLLSYFIKFEGAKIVFSLDISVIVSLVILATGVAAYLVFNHKK